MYAVGRLGSYITRGVYSVSGPFHPFGGAVDIIVVEQPDGTFKSSPWYVRFGKFQGVLKAREKVVTISVNGVEANFHMYLDQRGEAYFLMEVEGEDNESGLYPSSSGDETEGSSLERRPMKSKSYNYDANGSISDDSSSSGKIVTRTNSRRSRMFGLWGRRKSVGFQVDADGPGVGRVDSLERAEIAADLLEMKWSTNISTKGYKKERTSRLSSSNDPVSKSDKDLQIHDGKGVTDFLDHDNGKVGSNKDVFPDEIVEAALSVKNVECSVQESSGDLLNSGSLEPQIEISAVSDGVNNAKLESEVVRTSRIGETVTVQKHELERATMDSHELSVENVQDLDADVISELTKLVSEASVSSVIGHNPGKSDELIGNNKNVDLPECNISKETGPDGLKSLSRVMVNELMEQTCEAILPVSNGTLEARVETAMLCKDICAGPPFRVLKGENEQDAQQMTLFQSSIYDSNELYFEEPVSSMRSFDQTVNVETGCDITKEAKPHSICSISATSAQADEKIEIGDSTICKLQYSKSTDVTQDPFGDCFISNTNSTPPSESLSEEQFLFSDLDEDKVNGNRCVDMSMAVSHNEEGELALGLKYGGVTGSADVKDNLDISSENSSPDNSSSDVEDSKEMRSVVSDPINIARSHNIIDDEVPRLVESMPIMRSMVNSLDLDELHVPLSQTMDLDSKSLEVPKTSKEDLKCSSSGACEQNQLMQGQLNANQNQVLANAKPNPHGPLVELSLCRHLLYDGMGADAASKAFDAEKLDVEKFTTLGAAVVKKNKLVVRIGNRYFPWDAAGPIVLGMVSFGSELIFEREGMIAVDQVERSPVGDSSKAIVASDGNWKIWPFSFRRSGSRKIIPKSKSFDAGNLSEDVDILNTDATILKPKTVKRMVRVVTPTSKQLASLNLKEGSNVVTFTFSTGMLGNQQVDARIYLWKWNTRIIISDVDGTITKSDVLGQVMPLVGMDWSHIGVAHLFSAIKENGYQMLFLSARAISQAYHTRQFLFNLKQEGKTLPDGPVVISPDGLFPSLYREVIRRAPHEFKIACLEEIKALFPPDHNPFYAGFGNRDTDEISYLKVGIPKGKIFIINPKGEVAVNRHVNTKSYKSIHALVHGMFPPTATSEQEDYNAWNYWKLPPPEIDI